MSRDGGNSIRLQVLLAENQQLRAKLEEAEETLRAIREGEVDAIIVSGSQGEQVFSLTGTEHVYRLIVETMKEAALTVTTEGRILFCNGQFGALVQTPLERILGRPLAEFVAPDQGTLLASILARSQKESAKSRIAFQDPEGSLVPAHVSATALCQADSLSICLVATDLTELETSTEMLRLLRAQQEALQKAQEELEMRVRERTEELTRTVDVLQAEVARRTLAEAEVRERSQQLRALASELTLAEQRERSRVAEILHDHVQQLLVGARLHLAILERMPGEVGQTASAVEELINQSLTITRSLTGELNPPILLEGDLVPVFEWLARWMENKHGLKVDLTITDTVTLETDAAKILLFQAVRELLFNIVKHAKVTTAHLVVDRTKDQMRVVVWDEGVGFDPARFLAGVGSTSGIGLFSVRERLDLLGGHMEIESAPGAGSRFTLMVPLGSSATENPHSGN